MVTMNISLPQQLKDLVEAQVASGRYANASDYVRDLIRQDEERRHRAMAEFQELLDQAIASGPPEPFDFDDFIARMKARHAD